MSKRIGILIMRLCAVAVFVAMVGTPAEAGCKKLSPSGPTICASWIPGSLDCVSLLKGVKAQLAKECNLETGENCPVELECKIYGTFGAPGCDDPNEIDPALECEIEGELACCNPQFQYNEQGTAFNLPGPAGTGETTTLCGKGGKCFDSSEVDFNVGDGICNNNWHPDFTPTTFKGEICVCPGGTAEDGMCCADLQREVVGGVETCVNPFGEGTPLEGQPQCIQEFCTISNEAELTFCTEEGTVQPEYDCVPIPAP